MHSLTSVNQYMFLISFFVCVRMSPQMCKLINDSSKIFFFCFYVLFFFFEYLFRSFLLSTSWQSHGFKNDCAYIYTRTMTSLLEITVYDRLPVNFTYHKSTKKRTRIKIYGNIKRVIYSMLFQIFQSHSLFLRSNRRLIYTHINFKVCRLRIGTLKKTISIFILLLI